MKEGKRKEPILISDVVEVLSNSPELIGKEFEFPVQQKVNNTNLVPYVRQILETLGHPEAFVTDETMIGDFVEYPIRGKECQKLIKRLSQNLGIQVQIEDFLVEVAKRLKMKKEENRRE